MFPSRLGLGSGHQGGGSDKFLQQQMKEITNIFRRVYRIYAHAWFQHRDMFWKVEGRTGLYIFFKTVCDEYNLIQHENYTIPTEAEGEEPKETENTPVVDLDRTRPTTILPRPGELTEKAVDQEAAGNSVQVLGNTTKRHTRGGSNMSGSVHTIIQEEIEEEEDGGPDRGLGKSNMILQQTGETAEPESAVEVPPVEAESAETAPLEGEPSQGVTRSNTLKQEKQVDTEPETKTEPADDEVGETTVIEVDGAVIETKSDEPGVEVKIEPIDPIESAAADGDEAGKTVAD